MRSTDQMLARIAGEIEEKQQFIDGIVEDAEKDGRDLTSQEMELVTRSRDRLGELNEQAAADAGGRRDRGDVAGSGSPRSASSPRSTTRSRRRSSTAPPASTSTTTGRRRSATRTHGNGSSLYERAAAHQTTADNPGLLPTPVVAPVINFIDASRPITSFLGPQADPVEHVGRGRR